LHQLAHDASLEALEGALQRRADPRAVVRTILPPCHLIRPQIISISPFCFFVYPGISGIDSQSSLALLQLVYIEIFTPRLQNISLLSFSMIFFSLACRNSHSGATAIFSLPPESVAPSICLPLSRIQNIKGETLFHSLAKGNTWQREENYTPQGTVYREIELPSRIYGGIIVVLLLNGVRMNQRDKKGKTPLHIAAAQGTPSFIRLLIQRGAKTKKKDRYGRTIVHYAMKNRKESIQAVLAKYVKVA
jgi:hypothetical protein